MCAYENENLIFEAFREIEMCRTWFETSAIDSERAEKVIFLESDKTTSHRLELLIEKAKNKGLTVEKISKKDNWTYNNRHSVVALCIPKNTYDEKTFDQLTHSNMVVLDHIQDTNNFGAINCYDSRIII